MALTPEMITKMLEAVPPRFPITAADDMIPVNDPSIDWESMIHRYLTCKNHPYSRYMTKNFWSRGLHYLQGPNGIMAGYDEECSCPECDLVVIKSELRG
jgi:hypothetical protein